MGFEDYTVVLYPSRVSLLWTVDGKEAVEKLRVSLLKCWTEIHVDDVEMAHLQYRTNDEESFLVYESPHGLIQILIKTRKEDHDVVIVSIRFAYCNPKRIVDLFINIVIWLMDTFSMECYVLRDFAPEQREAKDRLTKTEDIRSVLEPSIEYNRKLWQKDAGYEEACLRPGEALARFISPRLCTKYQ